MASRERFKSWEASAEDLMEREKANHLTENSELKVKVQENFVPHLIEEGRISVARCIELATLLDGGKRLLRGTALGLCRMASDILKQEPNVVKIAKPEDGTKVNVVGDLHGSLDDLMEILTKQTGPPSAQNKYIFNGDFVDRGTCGIECLWILLAWKVALPDHVTLIRGNHEDSVINCHYGFDEECEGKYDADMHTLVCDIYPLLPLCAVVEETAFVVHGGTLKLSLTLNLILNLTLIHGCDGRAGPGPRLYSGTSRCHRSIQIHYHYASLVTGRHTRQSRHARPYVVGP